MCHTCSQTFASIDALYAHQNELGHLELTQTPTGPGYLCWQPGCQQYFRTAVGVQSHHRDVHSSASEYRFRCADCRMAFKSAESLRAHAYCHSAAVQRGTATSAEVFQLKGDATTVDASAAERERYRANLAAASSLALLGGEPAALEGFTAGGSTQRHGSGKTTPTPTTAADTPSAESLRGRYIDELKLDENYNSNLADTLMPATTKDAALVRGVPMGDSEYAGLKFKCHRCKVGFAKMSQLSAHNRTPAHRQGARMTEVAATTTTMAAAAGAGVPPAVAAVVGGQSLEKYRDPNRPFKCDVCRESFTQKNILLVHYNSVSHLHRLKQQQQQQQLIQQQGNDDTAACESKDTVSTDSVEESTALDGPTRITEEESQASTTNVEENGVKDYDSRLERNDSVSAAVTSSSVPSTSGNSSLMTSFGGCVSATTVENPSSAKTNSPTTQSIQISATTVPVVTSLQVPSTAAGVDRKLAPTIEDRTEKQRPAATNSGTAGSKQIDTQPTPLQSLQQQQQMQMFLSDMFQRQFLGSLMPTPELLSGMFGAGSMASGHADVAKSTAAALMASEPTDGARSQAVKPHHQRTCPHTCYQCGAIFGSADHLHQHQMVQCPASGNANRVVTTGGAVSRLEMPSSSVSGSNYKSRIQQVLLESIGFECVMQYNENRQRSRKNVEHNQSAENSAKPSNVNEETVSQTSANKEESTTTTSEEKVEGGGDAPEALKGGHLPELKRCTCTKCSKEFSSVWVLKAHEEEVHSAVLPIDSVEEFARQLRIHYDSRQTAATTTSEFRPSLEPSSSAVRATKKTETTTATAVVPQTSESARVSRMTSGQLAADLAAMQHAAAQLMHLPLMMGLMGAASGPATPAATAGMLPMMLPLSPEFFGIPPTFSPAMMDPATMMMLSQQQQQQQQQQRGLRTGTTGAPIQTNCAPGVPPPQPPKSARTRINDEQLAVLRAHFDINNSPSEEQIHAMSDRTRLPPKVIKHWFRNTLFKERQRNKDSPYNFSVPPATTLNIDDYERTAPTAKRTQPDDNAKIGVNEPPTKMAAVSAPETSTADPIMKEEVPSSPSVGGRKMVAAPPGGIIPAPIFPTDMSAAAAAAAFAGMCQLPPVFSPMSCAPGAAQPPSNPALSAMELHSHERRANRTRFTNHQIQVLPSQPHGVYLDTFT